LWPTHARPPWCGSAFLAKRVHTPAHTRARERARRCRHPSPYRCVAPLRRAAPSLTTARRVCHPYHALVLVGRAVNALFASRHAHISFHRLVDALSAAGEVLSAWMRKGRFDLELANVHAYVLVCKLTGDDHPATPSGISISRPPHDHVVVGRRRPTSHFSLPYQCHSVYFHALCLALSNCMHTHARARDASVVRGTATPSRLCRPRLRPCRDCVAVLPALAAMGDLSTWAREHHAKPVHAFVMRTQVSAPALVPPGRDAEAIGFAWPREPLCFAVGVLHAHAREGCQCQHLGQRRRVALIAQDPFPDRVATFGRVPHLTVGRTRTLHRSSALNRPPFLGSPLSASTGACHRRGSRSAALDHNSSPPGRSPKQKLSLFLPKQNPRVFSLPPRVLLTRRRALPVRRPGLKPSGPTASRDFSYTPPRREWG
jgi:hypothetical protein